MKFNDCKDISKIVIHPPQDLSHPSYIITGIILFCQKYSLRYEFKNSVRKSLGRIIVTKTNKKEAPKFQYPKAIYIDLLKKNQSIIMLAFDLYDLPDHFPLYALDTCDFIFKRNYESKYTNQLSIKHQNKLFRLGLSFGVFYKKEVSNRIYLMSLIQNLRSNLKYDSYLFRRLITTYNKSQKQRKFIKTQRLISQYEHFESGTENSVLFQTRVFPNENSLDTQQIHADRYRIIKRLKKEFPKQFKGGFVPSPLAKQKYADALTNVPTEPSDYLEAVKDAKIVIYTRGLANSPAWKMPEYLSQGKIIIAESLTAELPRPLEHGKEVLFFDTDEELVKNIKKVMKDKNLQNTLSENARAYFEEHVHPFKTVERIISITLQDA